MWYVYVLSSKKSDWRYVGYTGDLMQRIEDHNKGRNQSTRPYAPFDLEAYIAVQTEEKARQLEKYFKTGSGRAVLYKRIL